MSQADTLVVAAVVWWRQHKPESYGDAEHLANPKINTCTAAEAALAQAVADYVRSASMKPKSVTA